MDGRLVIEQSSMLQLLEIVVNSNPFEERGTRGKSAMSKGRVSAVRALFRRNPSTRSRRNVAHHYDLDGRLYRLFLDPDLQYSCAYFTDSGNSLAQAQADKKAHIAAKLHLQTGNRVLDIGCGWGGLAIYLAKAAEVEVLGVTHPPSSWAMPRPGPSGRE
jgi:cyclopropane-fatty-acyl-phospholipid synthase